MKLTKHGIPDLNSRPVNGHRVAQCRPHLPGPIEIVATRWEYDQDYGESVEVSVHGRRCLKCRQIVGGIV